jgi:hypothetical protein
VTKDLKAPRASRETRDTRVRERYDHKKRLLTKSPTFIASSMHGCRRERNQGPEGNKGPKRLERYQELLGIYIILTCIKHDTETFLTSSIQAKRVKKASKDRKVSDTASCMCLRCAWKV